MIWRYTFESAALDVAGVSPDAFAALGAISQTPDGFVVRVDESADEKFRGWLPVSPCDSTREEPDAKRTLEERVVAAELAVAAVADVKADR